jgi:acyl transferase domain-containing protein/phosphopantetheinyl transferase
MAEPIEVAIVGMAAVFPGASELLTYWSNIRTGVDAITDVPATRWDPSYYDPRAAADRRGDRLYCRRGGFVENASFDPARYGIMPAAVPTAEPDQLLALQVAAEALADSAGGSQLGDRSRVGVILGRGGYLTPGLARLDQRVRTTNQLITTLRELLPDLDDAVLDRVRNAFQAQLGPHRPEAAIDLVPNLVASRVANRLDLTGPAYTIDAACASSLVAIDHAVTELTTGRCDVVLAGGVHHCHDITLWSLFTQLGALSPSQRIRPFHRDADGILIGEGTGVVVLKRLGDAGDDRIYAVIRGTGIASDGRATSLMSPHAGGQVRAIERAWQAAALDPTEPGAITLVEAHGTATPTGDQTELTSLNRVFGPPNGAGADIGIGSVKSMIGHALPAAGIASLIKAALAIYHGVLPPTLHCDDPHPALAGTRFAPITRATPWATPGHTLRRAAVNAFGFGGINAHAILEQPPSSRFSARSRPSGPERVLLLAGSTPAELAGQLQASDTALLDCRNAGAPPRHGGPCRLAIVAPTPRRLALARRIVHQGRSWRGRDDVWFTPIPLHPEPATGRLAFVFPGLEQGFEPRIDDVADHFGLDRPDLGETAILGRHSVGVLAVGRLLDAALRQLGVAPDVLAGHSIGEWNAMAAAGIYPRRAVEKLIASFDPATLRVPDLVFAALGCGADQATQIIEGLDGVVVSHDNCPHQSIICGSDAPVAIALDRMQAHRVTGQVLPFRSGFHSPMLAPYLSQILDVFAGLPVRAPANPIWSATTIDRYPDDPDHIRHLATRHLLEPVRFGPLIQQLYQEGTRAFIQVGTGSLPAFITDALAGLPHLAITANTSRRPGLDQLRRVAAALWVEGWAPRFDQLPLAAPVRTPVRPEPSNPVIPLDLGAPLIRLGDTTPTLSPTKLEPTRPAVLREPGHPLLGELDAALLDATTAATDVVESWARTASRHSSVTHTLSLATMPYLADHCFYRQPDGWPDPADRYPVVPLTTMLELMADAARVLRPDHVVIGMREVRALRWLAVAPPVTVTTTATPNPDGTVTVVLDGYARGTVILGSSAEADLPVSGVRCNNTVTHSWPAVVTAEALYRDRWMFHGPAFQGVTELGPMSDDGIVGELIVPNVPGALLDNAGQLLGFWIMMHTARDRLAFPSGIDQVRYYGPSPRPGERVHCAVRIKSVFATDVVADLELRRADGRLWARLDRWTDRRFTTDEVTWPVFMFPERNLIAQRQPGGWFLVHDRWSDPAIQELIMRRYLSAGERAEYQRRTPRAARQWLLGRVAVKDAVRQWLWDAGAGPMFPIEIEVSNDTSGKPRVSGAFDIPPQVSLAHTRSLAAALVGPPRGSAAVGSAGVGIDIERIEDQDERAIAAILTASERHLLDALCSSEKARSSWVTRFWAAKEATAKAIGTGLAGRPHQFAIERVDQDRLLVATGDQTPSRWTHTGIGAVPEPYAVAWTEAEEGRY